MALIENTIHNNRKTKQTNPNRIVYFMLRVLAASFMKTPFIFYGKLRSNNNKELYHRLNRRSRELTI